MSHSKAGRPKSYPLSRILLIAAGDLLALLLFVLLGRRNHALSLVDLGAILATAAPLFLGWFLVAPWFGLFRAGVIEDWRRLIPRLLLAWLLFGGPLALLLRALWLGRAIPAGIPPSFAAVTLAVTTLFLLVWRLGYLWWLSRRPTPGQDAENLNR